MNMNRSISSNGTGQVLRATCVMNGDLTGNTQDCQFSPPPAPINVQLKIIPEIENGSGDQEYYQEDQDESAFSRMYSPLPPCPVGNRTTRTFPILPVQNFRGGSDSTNFQTTYKRDFFAKTGGKTQYFNPVRSAWKSGGKETGLSSYKQDFPRYEVTPFRRAEGAHKEPYRRGRDDMQGFSSYKSDFPKKQAQAAKTFKPKRYFAKTRPTFDLSTYRAEYVPHILPDRFPKVTNEELTGEICSPCAPFEGCTIYKQDFINRRSPPCQIVKPVISSMQSSFPLEHSTTYRTSYEPFYFANGDCDPTDLSDRDPNPTDLPSDCADVQGYPETERISIERQLPVPPCGMSTPTYGGSPYRLDAVKGDLNGTTITIRHNTLGDQSVQNPIIIDCPRN